MLRYLIFDGWEESRRRLANHVTQIRQELVFARWSFPGHFASLPDMDYLLYISSSTPTSIWLMFS